MKWKRVGKYSVQYLAYSVRFHGIGLYEAFGLSHKEKPDHPSPEVYASPLGMKENES